MPTVPALGFFLELRWHGQHSADAPLAQPITTRQPPWKDCRCCSRWRRSGAVQSGDGEVRLHTTTNLSPWMVSSQGIVPQTQVSRPKRTAQDVVLDIPLLGSN